MYKLCFGTFMTVLANCSAVSTNKNTLCGKLLLAIDQNYDICGDNTTVSKLMNGYSNVSPGLKKAMHEMDTNKLTSRIKKDFLPYMDQGKYRYVISSILDILYKDDLIDDNTEVHITKHLTKKQLLECSEFVFEEFIAGLLFYVILYTDNKNPSEVFKIITNQYVVDTYKKYNHFEIINACKDGCNESVSKDNKEIIRQNEKYYATRNIPVKLFNGETFSPAGLAIMLGTWSERTRIDILLIEEITGMKYVDYIEDLKLKSEIETEYKYGTLSIPNLLEYRSYLVSELHEKHVRYFFDLVIKILEGVSFYNQPSNNIMHGVLDFITFLGNNLHLCKRISLDTWKNIVYEFEMKMIVSQTGFSREYLLSYADVLVEAEISTFLHVINGRIEENDAAFINMLRDNHNENIVYHLAGAIRKAASFQETFTDAMLILFYLSQYNKQFYNEMVAIYLPLSVQISIKEETKRGVLKNFFRRDRELTWILLSDLLPGNVSSISTLPRFIYIPVVSVDVSREDNISCLEYYIELLCDKMVGTSKEIEKLLRTIPYIPDNCSEMIIKSIMSKADSHEFDIEIWKCLQYITTQVSLTEAKKNDIAKLFAFYSSKKTEIEIMNVFSFQNHSKRKQHIPSEAEDVVSNMYKRNGFMGLLEVSQIVEDVFYFAEVVYNILTKEELYGLLDEKVCKQNGLFQRELLARMTEKEIVEYISLENITHKIDKLLCHSVGPNIIDYLMSINQDIAKLYWKKAPTSGCNNLSNEYFEKYYNQIIINKNYDAAFLISSFKKEDTVENIERAFTLLETYDDELMEEHAYNNNLIEVCIQELISFIQTYASEIQEDRVVRLEEKYMHILSRDSIAAPKFIYYKMANNPEYVEKLLNENNQKISEGKFEKKFYILTSHFNVIPGTQKDGLFLEEKLIEWYDYAKNVVDEKIRSEMISLLGKSLYHAQKDSDGFMVNRKIADFFEENADRIIMQSFEIEAINSRGAINVGPNSHEMQDIIDELLVKVEKCENEGYLKMAKAYRNILESYTIYTPKNKS